MAIDRNQRGYLDGMWRQLRTYAKHTAAIPARQRGSFEWLSAAGSFWWEAREHAALSRDEAAERAGLSVSQVRFLEYGLLPARELSRRRLARYAQALGDADLYDRFRDRFER